MSKKVEFSTRALSNMKFSSETSIEALEKALTALGYDFDKDAVVRLWGQSTMAQYSVHLKNSKRDLGINITEDFKLKFIHDDMDTSEVKTIEAQLSRMIPEIIVETYLEKNYQGMFEKIEKEDEVIYQIELPQF